MPPKSPELITDAEFRILRESMGFTLDALAVRLDVQSRAVRRWEAGVLAAPAGVVEDILALKAQHDAATAAQVGHFIVAADKTMTIPEPSSPDVDGFPPSWYRTIAGRVRDAVPGLRIKYAAE